MKSAGSPPVGVEIAWPEGAAQPASSERARVYDCFLLFNELDLLEIRLAELEKVVDYFVIVEAETTFRGAPKPLHFAENKERFAPFEKQIIHIRIRDFEALERLDPGALTPQTDAWKRQGRQRNALIFGLAHARPDDWVMLSDLDEIPRWQVIASLARTPAHRGVVHILEHDMFENRLNWRFEERSNWCGVKMIERRYLRSMQHLRRIRHSAHEKALFPVLAWRTRCFWDLGALVFPQRVPNAGWHFSTIGDASGIEAKLTAMSGGPMGRRNMSETQVAEMVRAAVAANGTHSGRPYMVAPLSDLPEVVRDNPERYAHLLG